MENLSPSAPASPGVAAVLSSLERELVNLDRFGAHIAAAHLDAAIQQLRLDQARRRS